MAFIEVARIPLPPEGPFSKQMVWWEELVEDDIDKTFSFNTFFGASVKTARIAHVQFHLSPLAAVVGERVPTMELRDESDSILYGYACQNTVSTKLTTGQTATVYLNPGWGIGTTFGDNAIASQTIQNGVGDNLYLNAGMDIRFHLADATSALDHMFIRLGLILYYGA
jgi:hypothetical protein